MGMQVKVTQEVPGNEDIEFQLEWARAISVAKVALAECIERHLSNFIDQIDKTIHDEIKKAISQWRNPDNTKTLFNPLK